MKRMNILQAALVSPVPQETPERLDFKASLADLDQPVPLDHLGQLAHPASLEVQAGQVREVHQDCQDSPAHKGSLGALEDQASWDHPVSKVRQVFRAHLDSQADLELQEIPVRQARLDSQDLSVSRKFSKMVWFAWNFLKCMSP